MSCKIEDSREFTSSLPADASLEERVLEHNLHKTIARMDMICSEIKQLDAELEEFVEDYYMRIGPLVEELNRLSEIIAKSDNMVDSCMLRGGGAVGGGTASAVSDGSQEREAMKGNRCYEGLEGAAEAGGGIVGHAMQTAGIGTSKKYKRPQNSLEREIRKLYRSLVKEFHPDVMHEQDMEERDASIIQQLNEAYEKRHLGSLWKIAFYQVWQDVDNMSSKERLRMLKYYDKKVRAGLYLSQLRHEDILRQPEYGLRHKVFYARMQGHDLIESIAEQMREEIAKKQRRIAYLRATGRLWNGSKNTEVGKSCGRIGVGGRGSDNIVSAADDVVALSSS